MRSIHLLALPPLVLALAVTPACLGGGGPPKVSKEQQYELYTSTAQFLYEDGKLHRAQDQAVKALAIEPDDVPMRRMIGWIRLRLGTNEDLLMAERFFRDLIRDHDDGNASLLGLATACERLGMAYEENARDADKSENERAKLTATSTEYWAESRALYERTLSEGEGDTRAMNGLQRVTALQGDLAASLAWSERLLVRAEENLAAWRIMLENQSLSASDEQVIRNSEQESINLAVSTHLFAASLLQDGSRPAEAVEHLDAVLDYMPDMAVAYSRRAQLRVSIGDTAGARSDLDQFLRLSEHDVDHPDIKAAFNLRRSLEG